MKTVTVAYDLFRFDELPEDIRAKVVERYHDTYEYPWANDAIDSAEAFAKACGFRLDYELDFSICGRSWARAIWPEGTRAIEPATSDDFEHIDTSGNCFDENLLDGVRAFLDGEMFAPTYGEVIQACLDSWVQAWVADIEYGHSEEAILRDIREGDAWYLASGNVWAGPPK